MLGQNGPNMQIGYLANGPDMLGQNGPNMLIGYLANGSLLVVSVRMSRRSSKHLVVYTGNDVIVHVNT